MSRDTPLVVELLTAGHDRASFDCGVPALNTFLKQYALQNQQGNFVRTYVCRRSEKILGYFSLTFGEARPESAPAPLTKGMGKYRVPAMILARLAVDLSFQGQGLGEALLKNAIMRTKQAAHIAGLKAIIVHAKDSKAQAFYSNYGFIPSLDDPLVMFFPVEFEI